MKPEKFKVKKLKNNPTEKEVVDTINEITEIIDFLDITKPGLARLARDEFLKKRNERLKH
jgi:hypothetical protein